MKKNRAFLKWAGGKYPLIEDIRRHLPAGDCLIEPFVGAGSVFLNTDYEKYILADINSDLINLYNIVKERTDEFIGDARQLFYAESNTPQIYYSMRNEFNLCTDAYRRAVLFLYLNRHCYNGLCRYNLSGEFNVPFGRYKKPYFPEIELNWFAEKAQSAIFVCEHYQKTLMKAEGGSVVYCDPPYVPLSTTANFTAYHTNSFNNTEQQNLARIAHRLASEARVPVLISNHDTLLTREWYCDAVLHVVKGRRTISRNILGRTKVNELLALYHYAGPRGKPGTDPH
ncbi:adenine-specific DNA-methyltransferase [Acerihabitans sp. KWT182]|uniref:Site-specific DNA-methyltransferase (adenine-specific) n=1 Tax=Acerihabitans sp. KWT182 TaxID=3157919 RepID=A0AAU7QAT4_9GAMM